jgi:hypothetical protein
MASENLLDKTHEGQREHAVAWLRGEHGQPPWAMGSQYAWIADLLDAYAAEVKRLEGIVGRLPKTVDGVTVVPFYDDVWIVLGGQVECCRVSGCETNRGWVAKLWRWDEDRTVLVCDCYSTRADAEAAKGESR